MEEENKRLKEIELEIKRLVCGTQIELSPHMDDRSWWREKLRKILATTDGAVRMKSKQYLKGKITDRYQRCAECDSKDCDCDFNCPACKTLGEYDGNDNIVCNNEECRVRRFFTQ